MAHELRQRAPKPLPKLMEEDNDNHNGKLKGLAKHRKNKPEFQSSFLVDTLKMSLFLISFTFFVLFAYNKLVISWSTVHPPGTLIKLSDGHSLHLHCKGDVSGRPILLFSAGIASPGLYWYYEQNRLSDEGWRVCVYDRSGIAWSEHSPNRHVTVQGYVDELHEMVQLSPISQHPAGYVLVGFSLGGAITARYIEQWPNEVRGSYIVDPHFAPHVGLQFTNIESEFNKIKSVLPVVKLLAECGFLRPLWYLGYLVPFTFDGMVPMEPLAPYIYLAAKPNGLYYGIIHELSLLDPGHGHYSNASTWEFIESFNKIPISVELRGQGFSFALTEAPNMEWALSRKALSKIVHSKAHLVMEDHFGRANPNEQPSHFQARTLQRLRQFLNHHFLNDETSIQ